MSAEWPPERIATLERMYLAGKSYEQMGTVLKVSKVRAFNKVRQLGWAPREKQGSPGRKTSAAIEQAREQMTDEIEALLRSPAFQPVTLRRFSWEAR